MASEWVGVVGTSIGAGIGGVVTVSSLWIKSKQDAKAERRRLEREDEVRADDRAWQVQRQNVEQRRDLYARLLRLATDYDEVRIWYDVHDGTDVPAEHLQAGDRVHRELIAVRSELDVAAVDPTITELTRQFTQAVFFVQMCTASNNRRAAYPHLDEATELPDQLRRACRRDLGLAVDVPDELIG